MKGEANARVTEVNAEATAKQTTLEGNAEAGIVLSKGEAEAKALALRAEAYRQFNEAAVIQTVLSMLPEIVRAAAEPMSQIDHLTVLSNDGASELVRNTTRTVTEASATVKGLTGIDVPALIGTSMGSRFGGNGAPPPSRSGSSGPKGGGGGSGTSGGSGSGSSGGGGRRPTSARTRREPPATRPAVSQPSSAASEEAPDALDQARADVGAAIEATVAEVGKTTERAREAVDRAIGPATPSRAARTGTTGTTRAAAASTAARPASTSGRAATSPAVGELDRESTLDEAAQALAGDLMRIPGIQRFGAMRLADLDSAGPRPLRTMWRIARDRLQRDYGNLTIGEIIDRYRGGGGEGGVSAGA
jgi:flotillin